MDVVARILVESAWRLKEFVIIGQCIAGTSI
jgi:hypothetical protein